MKKDNIKKSIEDLYHSFIKRLRFSITFKTTFMYTTRFISFLIAFSFIILIAFTLYIGKEAISLMERDHTLILSYIKESSAMPQTTISELAKLDDLSVSIYDSTGKVICTSEASDKEAMLYTSSNSDNVNMLKEKFIIYTNNKDGNDKVSKPDKLYIAKSYKDSWFGNKITIQITDKLSKEIFSILILASALLVIDILFIIMTVIRGSMGSRKLMLPVFNMTKTAKNITANSMDERLDISGSQDELKELAQTFNNMLDRLQEAYESQNQFVSDASHELRTPIAVIQGYANMVHRWGKNDPSVLEESIDAIRSESENMKELVEKLLFLARGDKNTERIEFGDFDLQKLILEIIKETSLIDNTHEIVEGDIALVNIYGDRGHLKEAIRIFIDNGLKYSSKEGKVTLSSSLDNNYVIIKVADNGIGISKEDLPHVFDRFYRADKSRTKETGGTGLGLSIAKWIIMKHKGIIEVESQLDVGTKIIIKLPLNSNLGGKNDQRVFGK